jgi:predicted aldo/keto reductase-like oxidoreductase
LQKVNQLLDKFHDAENLRKAAIKLVLEQPEVASCIIGHRDTPEVIENIQSAENI